MKQYRSQNNKQRILKIAIQEFVEKGYEGAHLQRIADRANTNKPVVYYYFKSKENLYEEVLRSIFNEAFKNVETTLQKKMSFKETVTCLVEDYITFLEKNTHLLKILMWENVSGGKHIKKVMRNASKNLDYNIPSKLVKLLEDVIKRGELRQVDATQTILSIIGMCVFYFIGEPTVKQVWKIDAESKAEFIEQRKKAIVDLILYGLLPRKEANKSGNVTVELEEWKKWNSEMIKTQN